MLIQATTPRPVFDQAQHPQYVYVHTLCVPGVSEGDVFFNATTNPELGTKQGRRITPLNEYPLDGGMAVLEYVLPFFELFKSEDKNRNLALVPFCTAGFGVTVKSGYRADFTTHEERTISFTMWMPVTGGGILRLADSVFDLANSSFDPWAPAPAGTKNLSLESSARKAHKLSPPGVAARRAERLASISALPALPGPEKAENKGLTLVEFSLSAEERRGLTARIDKIR
jgi:hypothetical protein